MMTEISCGGYRFPPEIIRQAIWLYLRFTLSSGLGIGGERL
jgi:putative transposase